MFGRRSGPIAKCHNAKKSGKWTEMVPTLFEAFFLNFDYFLSFTLKIKKFSAKYEKFSGL